MRLIEAIFPSQRSDDVARAVEDCKPTHVRYTPTEEDGLKVLHAFFADETAQGLVDKLQEICEGGDDWRILVYPVEATAPQPEEDEARNEDKARQRKLALREEIYDDVADGAALSPDFFILVVASTIVAALGLNADNVAAVIGAMVIAPLLGPILAVSLAAALGDFGLLARGSRNAVIGLAIGVGVSASMALIIDINPDSQELMSRTVAGYDSIFLALAAGVAAALSIVAGVSTALVGVMVAVALLPPAAALGLFLGDGDVFLAGRAGLLLTINVVCIMLAAQGVYFFKGVRPRTWWEKKKASRASKINLAILSALLAALAAIIFFSPSGSIPDISGTNDLEGAESGQ
ncbi:MAG: TIGR00341 family protein [Pseudomonadota bacterium]